MRGETRHIVRPFGPVYDSESRILILGSFPSVKSREVRFYYGHPRNRFWPLLARLLECPVPETVEQRRDLVLENRIALWDSIEECDITGSSDSSIRNAVPVDIMRVLAAAPVRTIYANGATSGKVYEKYLQGITGREITVLPSTSPANAAWSMERLEEKWKVVLHDLNENDS